ncbi:hypothetical protein [Amycolatopsis circi]|uniref:hypothetical protein n=1 Tax=Amycolatopsis circi TaxID=871959 RepID=UPI0013BEA30C|nr:hypothetical protein [Amycolatopsis circi]
MASPRTHRWRGLAVRVLFYAAWWALYTFVLRPLLPNGDIVGIVIIIVLSLGILAVPVISVLYRRKRRR